VTLTHGAVKRDQTSNEQTTDRQQPWIKCVISRLAVNMKFPIHIHIHRRLSCVHITTKLSQNTAVQERPFPQKTCADISFLKMLKINKSKN